jgi:hypothetical protein
LSAPWSRAAAIDAAAYWIVVSGFQNLLPPAKLQQAHDRRSAMRRSGLVGGVTGFMGVEAHPTDGADSGNSMTE